MIDSSRVAVGSHGQSCLCDGSFKVINNVISKGYTVLLLPDPTKAAKREGAPYVPIIPITTLRMQKGSTCHFEYF